MKNPRQDKAWEDFQTWCRGRRLCALPAHPWTVAAYLRWCEAHRAQRQIPPTLRAIAAAHGRGRMRRPEKSPLVLRTLKAVSAERRRTDAQARRLADLLSTPDLEPGKKRPRKRRAEKRASAATRGRALRQAPKLVSRRRLGG